MDRGIYAATSAGILADAKVEILNNNLANVNTPGFKRQYITTEAEEFERTLASRLADAAPFAKGDAERTPGVESIRAVTDFSMGSIRETSRDLDVALAVPDHFFVVNTADGPRYTRAGNFSLTGEGTLVTQSGEPLAGDITISGGAPKITRGGIVQVDGETVGQLQVVQIPDTSQLVQQGGNLFKLADGAPTPSAIDGTSVVPRSLELSNVSAIGSMVELIAAQRGFEMYTKTAQTIDGMNEQSIRELGRKTQ
ncbi:MAG: flagellar hook-basal body protein [Bdellovibrionales bacterium]|nr:flagellar hook-basal body protein [Bdellovibrionales bacterium]